MWKTTRSRGDLWGRRDGKACRVRRNGNKPGVYGGDIALNARLEYNPGLMEQPGLKQDWKTPESSSDDFRNVRRNLRDGVRRDHVLPACSAALDSTNMMNKAINSEDAANVSRFCGISQVVEVSELAAKFAHGRTFPLAKETHDADGMLFKV